MKRKEGETKEEGVVVGLSKDEMRIRRKMKMWLPSKTRGMMVLITPVIKIMDTSKEEGEGEDKN